MKSPVFRHHSNSLRSCIALVGVLVCGAGAAQAQQPASIADCRAIEGELARYACYESLQDPAAAADATPATAPQSPAPAAAPGLPARPVSNLPVVRRPSLSVGDLTGETAAAEGAAADSGTAVLRDTDEEKKPGLLRRLLPFGGDDDEEAVEAEAEAPQTAEAAPAAGSEVDNFGRSSARLETNDKGGQELVDTIAAIRTINQSMVEVTLESGQVWRQMISKRYLLKVGDTVTIRPTAWGSSFRLTSERISGFIQVQRVD
jgi:hypothetical protein